MKISITNPTYLVLIAAPSEILQHNREDCDKFPPEMHPYIY